MSLNESERWEIVVLADEKPEIIANVLRDAVAYLAESLGFDGHTAFDIAAFDPAGDCVSEYVFDPTDQEEK